VKFWGEACAGVQAENGREAVIEAALCVSKHTLNPLSTTYGDSLEILSQISYLECSRSKLAALLA